MSDLVDFLTARLDEDEAAARAATGDRVVLADYRPLFGGPDRTPYSLPGVTLRASRVLAEVQAKRRIVEWHKNWPVLVETQPTVEPVDSVDPSSFAYRASQQIAWMTEREYVVRFGSEPPTSPILRLLALPFADHPDYRAEEWAP